MTAHIITDKELAALLRQKALEDEDSLRSCLTILFWVVVSWCVVILFGWGIWKLIHVVLFAT